MKTSIFARIAALIMLLAVLITSIPFTVGADTPQDQHIKVLFIGNSYSEDASDAGYFDDSMLYNIMKSMVGDRKVTVGVGYSGSKTLAWHASAASTDQVITFRIASDTPNWTYLPGYTHKSIFAYTDWDVIVLQPYNTEMTTGVSPSFNDSFFNNAYLNTSASLPYLLDLIAEKAPGADAYLYLPFMASTSTEINTNRTEFSSYATQMRTLQTYKGATSNLPVTKVIPVGTAVHTARSTYLATLNYNSNIGLANNAQPESDPQIGLQRDPVHLSFSVGRYLANLVAAETIIPAEERAAGYTLPAMRDSAQVGKLPTDYADVIRVCADVAHTSAATAGRNQYLPTILTDYRDDPLTVAHNKLTITPIVVKEAADETELKALIAAEIKSITGYDVTVETTFTSEYTTPAAGQETGVDVEITVSHGYSGSFGIQTTVISRFGLGAPQFSDVSESDWFYAGVVYAASKGYMTGTNTAKTLFSPNMEFTREQFVQLLFNMEGLDKNDYAGDTGFSDVPAGKWYSAAVKWAKETGVTSGVGNGKFGLGGQVSREQLAMFLMNYARLCDKNTSATADLSVFSDASSISSWAKNAVSFAVAEGLIGSTSTSSMVLSPGRIAKRSEVARITMTYDAYVAKY